ncbi:hypothetical protein BDB01DRAFT_909016 [Pilobolus umbonatus]|nr:hypothetical protein BDB01DRAFT_909016 [Pilobolus umbonatus]
MFRISSQLLRVAKPLTRHVPTVTPRLYASPVTWRLFSHSVYLPINTTPISNTTKVPEEEEDIEEIDPKDYPELYPEESTVDESDEEVDTEWFVDPQYPDEVPLSEKDFIPLWQRRAIGDHLEDRLALEKVSKELMNSGKITVDSLHDLLVESKMDSVKVLDLREKCDWTDYMIVASSAKGDKYLSSIASHVGSVVKQAIRSHPGQSGALPMPQIEGRNDKSGWILIDLGRIIVHLFTPEMKDLYDLEGLWSSVSTDPSEPMILDKEE